MRLRRISGLFAVGLCVLLPIVVSAVAAAQPIGRADAIRLFREEILPRLDISGDFVAFSYPATLTPRDELSPYAPNPIPVEVASLPHLIPYAIDGPAWFFWIDREPLARYSHPTTFVLVDATDGSTVVRDERWWPVLNGDSLWTEPEDYWDEHNWVTAQVTPPRSGEGTLEGAACDGAAPRADYFDWALVVNGWTPGQPGERQFRADAAGMCRAFSSIGMKVSSLGPEEASPQAVETFIAKLFTERPLYTCCERLYVYFTGHASPGALWIGGKRLSASELARVLSTPDSTYVPSRVYVFIDSGYGGGFIPELAAHSQIMRVRTASAADEIAYNDLDPAGDPNPDDAGGEWTSSLVETLDELLYSDGSRDPLAALSVAMRRYYVALNRAFDVAEAKNAAAINGLYHPADYLFGGADPDYLGDCARFLARWDRDALTSRGKWESVVERYRGNRCEAFLRILDEVAKHNAAPPSSDYHLWTGKQCARDLSHSNFWDYCDTYWDVFAAPSKE